MSDNAHKNFLLGKYRDPEMTRYTVEKLQGNGINVFDVYSPFPIHGMEKALGLRYSRITVAAFMFGCLGLVSAVLLQVYMMVIDWPQDIGGKPAFQGPALVPVSFELTVLFTAFGMVGTFFLISKLFPWKNPNIMDSRVTDDVFVVALDKAKLGDNLAKAEAIFNETGAFEIAEKEVNDPYLDVYISY
jgi:hypothetical protein